jgi:hypothetical protein
MFWWRADFEVAVSLKAAETFGENVVVTETRVRTRTYGVEAPVLPLALAKKLPTAVVSK